MEPTLTTAAPAGLPLAWGADPATGSTACGWACTTGAPELVTLATASARSVPCCDEEPQPAMASAVSAAPIRRALPMLPSMS